MNLINASSVIALLETEFYDGKPQISTLSKNLKRRIYHAIESLVLYEDLILISPSLQRIQNTYVDSDNILSNFKLVNLSNEEEIKIKLEASHQFLERITMPDCMDLLTSLSKDQKRDEISMHKGVRSIDWEYIEYILPDFFKPMSSLFKDKFGLDYLYFESACYALFRTYYYLSLQSKYSCDLILHSLEGDFIKKSQSEYPKVIIDKFENDVKKKFLDRQNDWLRLQVEINYPMIVSYVINKSNSWKDVLKNTLELRNSKYARQFREGINELTETIKQNDNKKKDEILAGFENAKNIWSKSLASNLLPNQKLTITLPFIEIGTEFEFKRMTLNKKTDQKILLFVHELLRFS
jgi:hypothetical protein